MTGDVDRIRAIVRLDGYVDAYLYVGRFVEPEILAYIDRTKQAAAQYRELEGRRFDIQITFAFIFAVVALLLVVRGDLGRSQLCDAPGRTGQ